MKISFKSSVGCNARKGFLGGFHLLSWAVVEEEGQSRGAGNSVCVSIHSGLRGGQGDLHSQSHCQRDPITPLMSFPDQKAAPQPVHWLLEQHWAGDWGCVARAWWQWAPWQGCGTWVEEKHSTGWVCSPATTVTIGCNNTGDTTG